MELRILFSANNTHYLILVWAAVRICDEFTSPTYMQHAWYTESIFVERSYTEVQVSVLRRTKSCTVAKLCCFM